MQSPYRINVQDLKLFTPQKAENFIRDLLFSEARELDISISNIDFSSDINQPDGGADAYVEGPSDIPKEGLLYAGNTCYQVKSGGTFNPTHESKMKKELFGNDNPVNYDNLKKYVRKALDNGGHYILICLAKDVDNRDEKEEAIEVIKNLLEDCGYTDPAIDVWGPNKIIGFSDPYLSLALRYKQYPAQSDYITTHNQWARSNNMALDFHKDEARTAYINQIRSELRDESQAKHLHVSGAPGIGKTRLVLEATEPKDLKPLVIYAEDPDSFRNIDLMNLLTRGDNTFKVILVLDDCPPDVRMEIWNKLKRQGPRVKLLTIHTEKAETTGRTGNIDIQPLEDNEIECILEEYISEDNLSRWVDFCDGNPRLAHVIGQNLQNNPEDVLKPPDTVDIWGRFIAGREDPESQAVKDRRRVLRYIALFKRFGYKGNYEEEVGIISDLINENFNNITRARFEEIVNDLRGRKILQGTNTLYITPKPLHVKLWTEWWDHYEPTFEFAEFRERLEGTNLLKWFYEMFKYARESEAANEQVDRLLGEDGPFRETDLIETEVGGTFFRNLCEANPEAALEFLKNEIGTRSREELLNFTKGRRKIVSSLNYISVWDELFEDAATLLLQLGGAENESFSNNASGVFVSLFSPAPGKVAPTETPPIDRFPVLKQAIESDSKEKKKLGLDACDEALETMHFSRVEGKEYQGLREEPDLWVPDTYREFYEYYRKVWNLLCDKLESFEGELKERVLEILVNRGVEVGRISALSEEITSSLQDLVSSGYIDDVELLKKIKRTLYYRSEDMEDEVVKDWKSLKDSLTGEDFCSRLKRFISIDPRMIERHEEISEEELEDETNTLVRESLENEELLFDEINWLMSKEAKGAFKFGYKLAKEDNNYSLLEKLIRQQKQHSDASQAYKFLGGYLRRIREDDEKLWEDKLLELNTKSEERALLPELIRRSGLSESISDLLLELAEEGVISIRKFKHFGTWRELAEDHFKELIDFLIQSSHPYSKSSAVFLLSFYYVRDDEESTLPKDKTLQILTSEAFFKDAENYSVEQTTAYSWVDVAEEFIEVYPESELDLAEKMLANFGTKNSLVENDSSYATKVLEKICQSRPKETWNIITDFLNLPIDHRTYNLKNWLMGGRFEDKETTPIEFFPQEEVFNWVDKDIENRAWFLASFVPKKFSSQKWQDSLAREILVKYGNREDVRRNISANYFTGYFWGTESEHFKKKKEQILELREMETDDNVLTWINELKQELEKEIEEAKTREERRNY